MGVRYKGSKYCSKNFSWDDLIGCSETYSSASVANIPKQPATYEALRRLSKAILEPVLERYGAIKLTYCFGSPELTKLILRNIAPAIDQHAGYELNRTGKLICKRGGAAADFLVEEVSTYEVARFIVDNLDFDSLYYYGGDSPLHVSVAVEPRKNIVLMDFNQTLGKRMPKRISEASFKALNG